MTPRSLRWPLAALLALLLVPGAAAQSTYTVVTTPATWADAKDAAEAAGGHLAVISDAAENAAVLQALNDAGVGAAWIGFTDTDVEGTFQWVDGSAATFTFWGGIEPNNWSDLEHCTEMRPQWWSDGRWNDRNCSDQLAYVIEVPAAPEATPCADADLAIAGAIFDETSEAGEDEFGAGVEFIYFASEEDLTDLTGCSLVSFNPFTARVTYATPLTGDRAAALPLYVPYMMASSTWLGPNDQALPPNVFWNAPGAVALVAGDAAIDDHVSTFNGRVKAAVVYYDQENIFGMCGGSAFGPCGSGSRLADDLAMVSGSVAVEGDAGAASELAIAAFPNPARGAVTLRYTVPQAGTARVALYDVLGREVAVLADGPVAEGAHEALVQTPLPAGVYVARVAAGGTQATHTLTVVR